MRILLASFLILTLFLVNPVFAEMGEVGVDIPCSFDEDCQLGETCCDGFCLDNPNRECFLIINAVNCTGQQTCGGGTWGECILDDPDCGSVSPTPPNGGGGSGGGGGGGASRCKEGEIKSCGNQIGACEGAIQTCVDGKWTDCSVEPTDEICNTFDDDCEGVIDNVYGFITVEETSCWCVDAQNEPKQESCNGIDDDCNGIIDDYADCCFVPGETRDCGPDSNQGICEFGISICGDDELWGECVDAFYPEKTDLCFNELDDNCNGLVDDNCEHCQDNIQNSDEEGVDCGGSCLTECTNWLWIIIIVAIIIITLIIVWYWRKKKK
ncbi:MAG: MopE-related protein [Nanoarchaeota archaeon]